MDQADRSFAAVTGTAGLLLAFAACLAVVPAGPAQLIAATAALTGLVVCLWALMGVARSARGLAAEVAARHLPVPPSVARLAGTAGLAGRVVVIDDPAATSFVYGLLAPRAVLSAALLDRLTDAELRAVLEHEAYHVAKRDPLRIACLQALLAPLGFLPALTALRARHADARELAADRRAIAACGTRPLAGALLHAVQPTAPALAVSFAGTALHSRLVQMETGHGPRLPAGDLLSAAATVAQTILLATATLVVVACVVGAPHAHHLLSFGLATLADGLLCSALLLAAAAAVATVVLALAGRFAFRR